MTAFNRAGRTAVGIALVAVAAGALLSLVVRVPTPSTAGGAGTMADTGTTTGPGMMSGAGMMSGSGMMGGAGMGAMGAVAVPLVLLSLVALLALGYFGIRAIAAAGEEEAADGEVAGEEEPDPIARLQRRYTEGELTEDEFERALERELSGETTQSDGEVDGATAERPASVRER